MCCRPPKTFTPQELKDALTERGLPTAGLKADLQERLIEAIRGEGGAPQEEEGKPDEVRKRRGKKGRFAQIFRGGLEKFESRLKPQFGRYK